MDYIRLSSEEQLRELYNDSFKTEKGILIFKHSTRCAISSMALMRFKRGWRKTMDFLPIYYLDLLRHRDLSDKISEMFDVPHQSPQILLIKDGLCIYSDSHNRISPTELELNLNA